MKYKILIQIGQYLQKYNKINTIKRANDRVLVIDFNSKEKLFFDMSKGNSSIYKNDEFQSSKHYNAPFDVTLAKRFNSSYIEKIEVLDGNRILHIKAVQKGSYKKVESNIYFEFTGRFTNVVIADEKNMILDALSHYENQNRTIKPGKELIHLDPINIKEKESEDILNFNEFFKNEFEKINLKQMENVKFSKLSQVEKKLSGVQKNLNSLQSKEELLNQSEVLNNKARIITANLHNLKDFDRELKLVDFEGKDIFIKLEESPKNSTKQMFEESKKLKQKALGISIEEKNLNEKIKFLENLKYMLKNAKTIEELEILLPRKSQKKKYEKEHDNIENFYINEFKISVGKNEKGNILLLKNAKKNDFWFHIKDIPSAHVIVKTNKQKLSEDIIEFAANLCVNMSVKESGKYLVDFTKKENVKVINGAFVNYVNYDTIEILKV
ncbi:putative ribosome quality control (RQC) complex component, YloA/Tae2 family [Campylobacter blaseri]|uniref:NFACT RNA-binding domain-containing protein n=1 Tax=Campylobacter blaseri TaxID=2042961 RepID=A0A2P8R3X3_9BACT|nr:NFACT RNA binding domain-containing protein [Campylobacter blaseri]PSM53202.1 hypothetical protein CQ405_01245 [Campylobacter blaseri]PSM54668.1 hypothetical protein CRN67_01245 [Campylobacter blaseri]QKF86855.1 putative ribosome quality control (RQC) complex component, YloA/Tae2 family [Campylobacter blaseri]